MPMARVSDSEALRGLCEAELLGINGGRCSFLMSQPLMGVLQKSDQSLIGRIIGDGVRGLLIFLHGSLARPVALL